MLQRIHILGASGSGTTTLGRALAARLQCPHFDTDDYFWLPTDPPFTHQRERTERTQLLMNDVTAQDAWVVSGSLCGWGDVAIPLFELVVFSSGFPTTDVWRVSVNENTHGLGHVSALEGTCMHSRNNLLRGQHRMMMVAWTSEADNVMTSGLGCCRVPSSALKGSIAARSTSLC